MARGVGLGWSGKGWGWRARLSRSLTCLLTSSRLRATPLSALLLLASFWHFPLLHSLCFMTWDGSGAAGGWAVWNPAPPMAPPQHPTPTHLIGVVKEFQHSEDAGPDEQPHLASNVTCRGPTGRSVESGHSGSGGAHWDRRRPLGPGRRPCGTEASSPLQVVGCHTMPVSWEGDRCYQQLTQEPCNLIGLLLLDGLIVEDFKENVQHQDVFPAEGVGEETSVQVAFLSPTSWVTSASYPHRISVSVSIKLDVMWLPACLLEVL